MKNMLFYIALLVIVVMHAVGLYGLLYGDRNHYIGLTWLNLLITATCFLVYSISEHRSDQKNLRVYLLAFGLVCIAGFLVEVLGVKTGKIFGIYGYGDRLGYRLWDVPLIIGLNWGLLVFSVAGLVSRIYHHWLAKALVGATLLTLLDYLIEPVAMNFYYWTWDIKMIPVQNFIAWWIVSFCMFASCFLLVKKMHNRLGIWVYGVQLVFFALLNLLLK